MMRRHIGNNQKQGRRPPGGFTLIELVVTVTLVGILAAISAPAIGGALRRADARQVARTMANAFRKARNQAMSSGQAVLAKVEPDVKDGTVTLYRTDPVARSCESIDTDNGVEVESFSVADVSGDMVMTGIASQAGGSTQDWLCFAPSGRILDTTGQAIQDAQCAGTNFRLFVARDGATIEDIHKDCQTTVSKQQEQQDARFQANFWVIDVPFNGAIRAYQ
jgi:type IV fimbrial biogenesis protein FimT